MSPELPPSPYKGLSPFADTAIDAMLFFGREQDVEIVCANVVASRLTVLYGPSGVGKSSLLSAAVARRLRELPESPAVVVFSTWSKSPAAALARAVCAEAGVEPTESLTVAVERACESTGEVYLLLDQAEEYFLYHPEGGKLDDELAALVAGSARANVLLSLREDALAKLDRFKASIPGILGNYLRLDRLSREAGRAAVVKPLVRWSELGGEAMEIEQELTDTVLGQVATGRIRAGIGGSGEVAGDRREERIEAPYLQLVLERLWEVETSRGSRVLRAETLAQLGGAAQIVADHLERAMGALTPEQQEIASELLHQLVTPSGAKIAHAASDLAGYAGVPETDALEVLRTLAARRILRPGDDGRYEIYHDVLAAPVLAWRARYVQGRALVEAHRRNRRLALVASLAIVGLVVTALVAVFALVQRSNARSDARAAHARELDAAAASVLPTDPELGLLLARDSAVLSPTATAEDVLRQTLTTSRLRGLVGVGKPLLSAAVVGDAVVAAAADGSVVVVRPGSRATVSTRHPARDASISGRGDVLLTGSDGRIRVVSSRSARVVLGVTGARAADISADGRLAAVRFSGAGGQPSAKVRLVDVRSGKVVLVVDDGAPATAAAVSAGDKLLATGGTDRIARIWRIRTGKLLRELKGHVGPITAISFSARGTLVATASTDGIGRVWSAVNGQPVAVLSGHTNFLDDIGFSPDGTQVVTASSDRTARTWKAETGAALAIFAGSSETVASARFTGSGGQVVTAGADGIVRTWDAVVQPELALVADLGSRVTALRFTSDDRGLVATAGKSRYRVALPSGPAVKAGVAPAPPATIDGPAGESAAIVGKTVTITHADGTTLVLSGHLDRVTSVAFSYDGARVVTASADHDARIWDARSGGLLRVLRGHFAIVSDARFSPDGRWVVTAGPGTAGLWSADTGRLVYYLRGHQGRLLSVVFSPDSRRVATGGEDGTVRLWACDICGGTDELVALATARLAATGRVLSEEERQRYGL